MDIVVVAEAPAYKQAPKQNEVGAVRPGGTIVQHLLGDDAPDGLNFRFLRSQFQPGAEAYATPRHHHAFQQLRWAESGNLNYAPGPYIPEGDLAYFPRGTWYGPQLKDTGVSIALQLGFNGEQQSGETWGRYRAEALANLEARGVFDKGVYLEVDPETGGRQERDAVQALFEARTGQKWSTPAEGYAAPILMHPEAFEYFEVAPGLEMRKMGNFYDHPGPNADIRLSMLRLSDAGAYAFGPDRAQVAWSRNAGLRIGGTTYPELTFVYSRRDEQVEISSDVNGLELYLVEFPWLD
jgi:hypothetical protein